MLEKTKINQTLFGGRFMKEIIKTTHFRMEKCDLSYDARAIQTWA